MVAFNLAKSTPTLITKLDSSSKFIVDLTILGLYHGESRSWIRRTESLKHVEPSLLIGDISRHPRLLLRIFDIRNFAGFILVIPRKYSDEILANTINGTQNRHLFQIRFQYRKHMFLAATNSKPYAVCRTINLVAISIELRSKVIVSFMDYSPANETATGIARYPLLSSYGFPFTPGQSVERSRSKPGIWAPLSQRTNFVLL